MRELRVGIVTCVTIVLIACASASAAAVSSEIPYQGVLKSGSDKPLSGTYTVSFNLYDVSPGGTPLATDTHSVKAKNGRFATTLTFPTEFFDGRGLWLGIKRGTSVEASPRTMLYPVAYAIGLRPGIVGASFTASRAGDPGTGVYYPGLNVSTIFTANPGINVNTTGDRSSGVRITTWGESSTGLSATSRGDESAAIVGVTTGVHSPGLVINAVGDNSYGIYAWSPEDTGIIGHGKTGGRFSTVAAGTGSDDLNPGINVTTDHAYNPGIVVNTSSPDSDGIYVRTNAGQSQGINAETFGDGSYGGYIRTYGPNSDGLYIWTSQSRAIYAQSLAADGISIDTPNYIQARGSKFPSADVAEYIPVAENVTPGTVLIIGEDGRLAPSTAAFDSRVAGIVSTEPGIFLGSKEDGNNGEALVAVAGRVPCKVDATNGPIHPGDLLTTSDTPGYAMKAEPTMINGRGFYPDGTILGKALGTLESGTGIIEVLVTLQ